jgi:acyl-CoA synthetase (AMP-forming)/AMP-acid ligase II
MSLYTNSLWSRIGTQASHTPDKIVLQDTDGTSCTYHTFVNQVDLFAHELQQRGVSYGDRVLFLERPSIRAMQIFFALYRVGAIAVIADPAMGRENFRSRVEYSDCKYVVLDKTLNLIKNIPGAVSILRRFYPTIPDVGNVLPEVIVLVGVEKNTISTEEIMIDDSQDALIIFTSGTTSKPKGVVHTYGSLFHTLKLIQEKINTGKNDVFLSSQLHFSIIALISGATAVIDTTTTFSASAYIKNVERLQPTHTFLLPSEGQKLIDHMSSSSAVLSESLKFVMFGSAPVLVGFLARFKKVIHIETTILCIYGSTEILPICITNAKDKLAFAGKGDYLGKPLPGIKVEIKDDELLVAGNNLCARYLHQDDTLNHFTSGDHGFITDDGSIVMIGRKKDMIIKDHHNVYPSLFEPTISRIPGVKACAMVGVYNQDTQDEEIHLYIEKDFVSMSDAVFKKEVTKALHSGSHSIDSYAFPDHVHILEIPRSGRSQKPDKQALRSLLSSV